MTRYTKTHPSLAITFLYCDWPSHRSQRFTGRWQKLYN